MARMDRDAFVRKLRGHLDKQQMYSPLRAKWYHFNLGQREKSSSEPDFEISFSWRDREFHFWGEIKIRTSPRQVKKALSELQAWQSGRANRENRALLAIPYISSSIAGLLEDMGMSGIDLNGNYILQSDELVAIRLDQQNKYKESGGIKNVFRGTSSIVCRYFLHEPGPHDTVSGIYNSIRELGGRLSLSTVSKVLSTLDDEMIIEKGNQIRLLQAEKLLKNLKDEYSRPKSKASVRLDLPRDHSEKERVLSEILEGVPWVWGGETSAVRYAATTPSQNDTVYTRELPRSHNRIEQYKDERFYNCTLCESHDEFVYFGRDRHWASDVQTYLALMKGDKREREVARDIEDRLLNRIHSQNCA